jgi:hypothetical protein
VTPRAFDTETCLIRPALLAPPLVCLTSRRPGEEPEIRHARETAHDALRAWLTDPECLLVGHFAAYDCAVVCAQYPDLVPLVFAAYRANRITCTKKRQQLLDIAGGVLRGAPGKDGKWHEYKYGLDDLSRRLLSRPMQKDGWRLQYAEFLDVPLAGWVEHAKTIQDRARARQDELRVLYPGPALEKQWVHLREWKDVNAIAADAPEGVVRYPLDDATTTLDVYLAQEQHAQWLDDQFRQSYADFVLYLRTAWGMRTHGPGVEALRAELTEAAGELEEELRVLNLIREDGTRNMRNVKDAMIRECKRLGLPVRKTDAHRSCDRGDDCDEHVCLDSDACGAVVLAAEVHREEGGDGSPMEAYAEYSLVRKMLDNDVEMLGKGTEYPVHSRYDLAETGRSTSAGPALQNLNTGRVKDKKSRAQRLRKGVRQAFRPREGRVFISADFPQLELYTLAEWCYKRFGFSKLGDMLNDGLDPHLAFAAQLAGVTYEEADRRLQAGDAEVKTFRQCAKAFNFGKPGGMGDAKFQLSARKLYGVELTREKIKEYDQRWRDTFPEMRLHFAEVNARFGGDRDAVQVESVYTKRWRGGCWYCAACNDGFQGLGADCAKSALCLVAEAEYADPSSPLYGSRAVAFVHDELVEETDDGPNVHDAAHELGRLMAKGANVFLSHVPIRVEKMLPVAMTAWSKDAKQIWSPDGRLTAWSPV